MVGTEGQKKISQIEKCLLFTDFSFGATATSTVTSGDGSEDAVAPVSSRDESNRHSKQSLRESQRPHSLQSPGKAPVEWCG